MTPLEFIVIGTPRSLGAKGSSKTRWKDAVRRAVTTVLPPTHAVAPDLIHVTVVYFYVKTDIDVDNILKPILDSMNGLVYGDDFQVMNITAAKRDLARGYVLSQVSPVVMGRLVSPGGTNSDFVFVRVEPANTGSIP